MHRQSQARDKRKTRAESYQVLRSLLQIKRKLKQGLHSERCLSPSVRTHHHRIFRSRHCSDRPKLTTRLTTNLIIMTPSLLYFSFMYVIRNNLAIWSTSSNYRVQHSIFKDLLTKFEAHQHIRKSKGQKLLVESINQIQITRWAKDRLSVKNGNDYYTYWELMTSCVSRLLMNESYEYMKSKFGIIKSTKTSHLINICHPLQ